MVKLVRQTDLALFFMQIFEYIVGQLNYSYCPNLLTNNKEYLMKKFYLFFIVVLISSTSLFAQRQGISIGGNVVFPVGDWAEIAEIGYGGSATYEHPLGRNISGVIYSGYTSFGGTEEGLSWTMVPLLAGVKAYLSSKQDWYLAGLLGANFITAKTAIGDASFNRVCWKRQLWL